MISFPTIDVALFTESCERITSEGDVMLIWTSLLSCRLASFGKTGVLYDTSKPGQGGVRLAKCGHAAQCLPHGIRRDHPSL